MEKIILLISIFLITACSIKNTDRINENEYIQQIENWQQEELKYLKSNKNSPLNLAGLYWPKEGKNNIGSNSQNDIVFPENAPQFIGTITLSEKNITFHSNDEIEVMMDSTIVQSVELQTNKSGKPTVLETGSLAWYIIESGGHYLIRLRDYDSPRMNEFKGFEYYPIDPVWRIKAKFQPFDTIHISNLTTAIGLVRQFKVLGILNFEINGQAMKLNVSERGKKLITLFADETNGFETYGGGRILLIDKPDNNGFTIIDFNKTSNLSCAYTPFATCPMPSKENTLPVRIEAGEKYISK